MLLLLHLSGEHPTLPFSELSCLGNQVWCGPQVARVDCPEPETARRLALSHRVLEFLGECEATDEALRQLLRDLSLRSPVPFAARVTRVEGSSNKSPAPILEKMMGSYISGPVSLREPEREFRALFTGNKCYLGRTLFRIDRGSFDKRNPGKREFFHPGVMMPRIARALVNISGVLQGGRLLDPFCGTGGILLEASLLGANPVGGDSDLMMVKGSAKNLGDRADLILGDATRMPISDETVDSVVTDLPYGQSVRITAGSIDQLYSGAIGEIRRVLRPGKRAVIVTRCDIRHVAGGLLTVEELHAQRVHKSLTRWILVARKI